MTTETKTRQPRELAPGAAIAKLRALGSCAAFVEQRIEDAVNKAQDEGISAWGKEVDKILGKVHPTVRDAVKEAGVVPDAEPDDAPEERPGTLAEAAGTNEAIPAGAREYTPGPVARAARGTR